MKIITHRVHPDEPCHTLREGPVNGRWVQRLWVVRGDTLAKWSKDYGPVTDWPNATEIIYPSFGENTVGELQELAERDRHSSKWADYQRGLLAESTLISDVLKQEEEKIDVVLNRSQFGPGRSVQRIDFPREAVKRQAKEKRRDAKRS